MSEQRGPSRLRGVARQLTFGLAAVAVFWLLGHKTAAIVVVVAAGSLSLACAASRQVAGVVDTAVEWLRAGIGRALSFVLLGAVDLLVFTPVAILMWILRRDPLALGSSPKDLSLWRPHAAQGRRPLYRRQFTYEVSARPAGDRSPLGRVTTVLGVLVLVLLSDLAVGAAVDLVHGPGGQQVTPLPGVPSRPILAMPHTPWWPTVLSDTFGVAATARPAPFRGWTFPDYSSPYVHIADGVRRSHEPATSGRQRPIEVLFLGGSTMWGAYQRDDYTIPSDVARLASRDGIPIRVVNYGTQGYDIWQELALLEEVLAKGERPDVVVFYDGVNELFVQGTIGTTTVPSHMKAKEYEHAILNAETSASGGSLLGRVYDSYANESAVIRAVRSTNELFAPSQATSQPDGELWDADQSVPTALERAKHAVQLHRSAVDLIQRLAASYDFRAMFFWQPSFYSKRVVAGERNVAGVWGEDPTAWRAMTAEARKELRPPVIDLSQALDSVRSPVMIDFMHTNELGAEAVASAIYERLHPALSDLVRPT